VGLLAHVHREGFRLLSVKTPSPVELRREAFAERMLALDEGSKSGSVGQVTSTCTIERTSLPSSLHPTGFRQ
jgi:hypothetical protein